MVIPFLLKKCFLLGSGIAHLSVLLFCHWLLLLSFFGSSSFVHVGAPQEATLGLDLYSVSSFPGDLLPPTRQQPSSYSSAADLSLNDILLHLVTVLPGVSNKHRNDDKVQG